MLSGPFVTTQVSGALAPVIAAQRQYGDRGHCTPKFIVQLVTVPLPGWIIPRRGEEPLAKAGEVPHLLIFVLFGPYCPGS